MPGGACAGFEVFCPVDTRPGASAVINLSWRTVPRNVLSDPLTEGTSPTAE